MIKLSGVGKSFGSHEVLRDITFSVRQGEIVAVTGPSGCGKTTLLKIISGIVKPDAGSVELRASRVGFSFQKDVLFPWMTAERNITFVLQRYMNGIEAQTTADSLLERVGLIGFKDRKPGSLSGGMRKRLDIARAFAIRPDLLILDEPFAFLDGGNTEIVSAMISEAAGSGIPVIAAVHETDYLGGTGARIIKIEGSPAVIHQ